MAFNYDRHIRHGKLPHIWCPGCTYGIVFKSLLRAVETMQIPKDHLALVSGIGCASRLPGYVDWNTLHTAHGRAIPFATGLKMARPDFIHACRRNIDITVIVMNNFIYGMTGGQHSPTTPVGHLATTMPFGNIDPTFNIPSLAQGAGATWVGRGTAYHVPALDRLIIGAIEHKGLSVLEIINGCPTTHGRRNKFRTPTDMLLWMKESALPLSAFEKLPPDKVAGKFPTGVLYKREAPEFSETYFAMVERLQKQQEGGGG
jgi:2-oxoglutarate ferredoxin oxidoreductase subunit beta